MWRGFTWNRRERFHVKHIVGVGCRVFDMVFAERVKGGSFKPFKEVFIVLLAVVGRSKVNHLGC